MAKRKPYSKHTPNQRAIKRLAVEVAAFVIGLQMQEQDIKEGKGSYKKLLPADANWAEVCANEGALRRGSIMKQAAKKFGMSTKQISRYLERIESEGWFSEVRAELADDVTPRRRERGVVNFVRREMHGTPTVVAVRRRTRKQRAARAP
jgi:hypothetical protein